MKDRTSKEKKSHDIRLLRSLNIGRTTGTHD